jgi:hypothetical protein
LEADVVPVDPYERAGAVLAPWRSLHLRHRPERSDFIGLRSPVDVQLQRAEDVDRLEITGRLGVEHGSSLFSFADLELGALALSQRQGGTGSIAVALQPPTATDRADEQVRGRDSSVLRDALWSA